MPHSLFLFFPPLSRSVCSLCSLSLSLAVYAQSLTNENKELKVLQRKYEDLCESREQLARHCHALTCKYDERERETDRQRKREEKEREQLAQQCHALTCKYDALVRKSVSLIQRLESSQRGGSEGVERVQEAGEEASRGLHTGDAYQRCVA
jgi:peptidoglycan hydrolase CwlO-like protein